MVFERHPRTRGIGLPERQLGFVEVIGRPVSTNRLDQPVGDSAPSPSARIIHGVIVDLLSASSINASLAEGREVDWGSSSRVKVKVFRRARRYAMSKRTSKRRMRRKRGANHGKRPNT